MLTKIKSFLHQPVDNVALIVFRIFFGGLLCLESWGAIATGWVSQNLVQPQFTFNFIGFDFLQVLIGPQAYAYFVVMGIVSLGVCLGYRYRLNSILLALMWTGFYLVQKENYNNHYYLIMLIAWLMAFLPAHTAASRDVMARRVRYENRMPRWILVVFWVQIALVYFYATVAKLYPDWFNGKFISLVMRTTQLPDPLHGWLQSHYLHLFLAYAGFLFDLLIIPLLAFKRTRLLACIAALIFHLFNSITLQIGIFPFFALSFVVFFFPAAQIRKLFFPKIIRRERPLFYRTSNRLAYTLLLFFFVQLLLPLRHWFIPGDVFWTEEGHRLSWRMMLRQRSGNIFYRVVDKKTTEELYYPMNDLTKKQWGFIATRPDGAWQYAQRIKRYFADQGKDVAVYAENQVSVNQSQYEALIDPTVDLAAAEWQYWGHAEWLLIENGPHFYAR